MEPISVTVRDACSLIGVGRTKLYELIGNGQIEAIRIGGRRLVKVSSIRALVDEASTAGTA